MVSPSTEIRITYFVECFLSITAAFDVYLTKSAGKGCRPLPPTSKAICLTRIVLHFMAKEINYCIFILTADHLINCNKGNIIYIYWYYYDGV